MADKFRKAGNNLRKGVKSMIKESREIINNLKKKTSQEKGEDKSKDPDNSYDPPSDDSSDEIEDIGAIAANLMTETKKLTLELKKLEQEYDKQSEDKRRLKKEKEEVDEKYRILSKAFIDSIRIIDDFATGTRKSGPDQMLDFNEDMSRACVSLMKTVYDQRDNELMSNCILKYCTDFPTSPRTSVQLNESKPNPVTGVSSPVRVASPRASVTFAEPTPPKEVVVENHEELLVSIFQGLGNETLSPRSSATVTPVKTTPAPSNTSTPTNKTESTQVSTPEVKMTKPENSAVELTKKSSWTSSRPKSVALESSAVQTSMLSNKRMSGAVDLSSGTMSSPMRPSGPTLAAPTQQSKPYSAPTSPHHVVTATGVQPVSASQPTSPAGPANVNTAVSAANPKSRASPAAPTPPSNAKRKEPPRLSQVIPNYRPPKKTPSDNPPTASSPSQVATGPKSNTSSPAQSSALDKLLSSINTQPTSPTQPTQPTSTSSDVKNTPPPKLNLGSNPSTPTNKTSAVQSFVASIEKQSPRATSPTSPRGSVSTASSSTSPRHSTPVTSTVNKTTPSSTVTPVTSPTNKATTSTSQTVSPAANTKSPEPAQKVTPKSPTNPVVAPKAADSVVPAKKVESSVAVEKVKVEEKATSPRKENTSASSSTSTPTKTSENNTSNKNTNNNVTNNSNDVPFEKPVLTDESDAEDLIKFILRSV